MEVFAVNSIVKYGLIALYAVNFGLIYATFNNQLLYIKFHQNSSEAIKILKKSTGSIFPTLPLLLLLGNLVSLFDAFSWLNQFSLSRFNYGIYDLRNRKTSMTTNFENFWFTVLVVWSLSVLFLLNFSILSFYSIVLSIGIYKLILTLVNTNKFQGYYSVIVGEYLDFSRNIYNGILVRVLPEKKKDWQSRFYLSEKEKTYSIIFYNLELIYIKSIGFTSSKSLLHGTEHLIIRIPKEDIPFFFVSEYAFSVGLKSPVCIIDIWQTSMVRTIPFEHIDGDYNWARKRLSLLQTISDEGFINFEENVRDFIQNQEKKNVKTAIDDSLFRTSILNQSSFESLRQNIELFSNQYSKKDRNHVEMMNSNGIFEFHTLFRQLHESPAIPTRFIDLLNIAECQMRYLTGFLHSERLIDGKKINVNLKFDTKAISYGTCNNFISQWLNTENWSETILGSEIGGFLKTKYDDEENINKLKRYLKKLIPGNKTKYPNNPTILEIHWWLVTIRNKTRGHGTPSKVDYNFYVCLEKLILFLISEFSKHNFSPCFIANHAGSRWTINLSNGGCPDIVPIESELIKGVHFNPMLEEDQIKKMILDQKNILSKIPEDSEDLFLRIRNNNLEEWWKCNDHFHLHNCVLHLLNERDDKKESWISFSTGNIIRPEIISN